MQTILQAKNALKKGNASEIKLIFFFFFINLKQTGNVIIMCEKGKQ